ncbi:MAG: hypothetical protein ACM3UU_08710 [Ignavibacteriales bacterium]
MYKNKNKKDKKNSSVKKTLYEVNILLRELSQEERAKIPQKVLDYIEKNMEADENITIDFSRPLQEQVSDEAKMFIAYILKFVIK